MKRRYRCFDELCRNFKHEVGLGFCPECKGQIAMKYISKKQLGNRTWTIQTAIGSPNPIHPIPFAKMKTTLREITYLTFSNRIFIPYVNAYFGYASAPSKGKLLKDDASVKFYTGTYKSCAVYVLRQMIEKSQDESNMSIYYLFADREMFEALVYERHHPAKVLSDMRNPSTHEHTAEYEEPF